MKITELFTLGELVDEIEQGYVRVRNHPEFPELAILNYTEAAQFERRWNHVTKNVRGLIYNSETLEVLARPFQKIHNWDEGEAPRIVDNQLLYSYSNKYDGSLGIGYVRPDGRAAIATRGSFESDQAIHATELLRTGLVHSQSEVIEAFHAGYTLLYEIIYPENRIVLNYGETDTLQYLGQIQIESGLYVPGEYNEQRTMHDLLMDLSRPNAEGWVAWLTPWKAVKIKQADYVELHRIVTGLNRKSIWRALRDREYDELIEKVPDELFAWADGVSQELAAQFNSIFYTASTYWWKCGGYDGEQRDFARRVQEIVPREYQGLTFSMRNKKSVDGAIWKMIEPVGGER